MQCLVTYRTGMYLYVSNTSYFFTLCPFQSDSLFTWLFFKAKGGPRAKTFEEHGHNILGLFRHSAVYVVFIVVVNEYITIRKNPKTAIN